MSSTDERTLNERLHRNDLKWQAKLGIALEENNRMWSAKFVAMEANYQQQIDALQPPSPAADFDDFVPDPPRPSVIMEHIHAAVERIRQRAESRKRPRDDDDACPCHVTGHVDHLQRHL